MTAVMLKEVILFLALKTWDQHQGQGQGFTFKGE